jgi:hypothetical protein
MKAIAAGNVVAVDLVTRSLVREANRRMVAVGVMQCHLLCVIELRGAGGGTCLHQIFGDLGLAVHQNSFTAGVFFDIDTP